ncbi:MAG TPA: pyridine nucleotide-disulfide oxidoreductase [Desulfobacteraceae bacterium]|nr:pyridine nucleotide-disulfide oxidoreductase [Desulfobacteraceae bacterium]
MKFVIIGGDAAGMSAASRAKRRAPELEVIVFEQTQDVSYSACGMPYNLADPTRPMDDLVVRPARVFREKQNIDLRTGHRVERINREGKTVSGTTAEGKAFKVGYDKLLIATGASPIKPPIDGADLPGVMYLKLLEDGRRIKAFIKENNVTKVVIIGMGYIALEMCEALRERNVDVAMVKPRPVFLPWMHPELAARVRSEVESHGVELYPGYEIKAIHQGNGVLKVTCKGIDLEAQMVLTAVGVKPNSELTEQAGLELGPSRAIAVDRQLRTSDPDIYAAGDCADAFHIVTGERTWVPLALRANRAGWAVADNVLGTNVELEGIAGTAVFKVFKLQVARTGLNLRQAEEAGFEPAEIVIKSRSRAHAHPGAKSILVNMVGDRKSGRLLGVQMVGEEGVAHRINAAAVALHARMTVEEFSQCDLAYAPPFSPVWDPLLTAANQLLKQL